MRKFLLGCSVYRGMMPATVVSREHVFCKPPTTAQLAGTYIAQGYGAIRNASQVLALAVELAGPDGFCLHHDADVVFEARSVQAIFDAYDALRAETGSDRHVIGAGYPSSSDPAVLVGHPTGPQRDAGGALVAPADRLGFGFILIPCSLLSAMPTPWLDERWDGKDLTTGDTVFCENVLRHEASVWIANVPGVKHHVTVQMGLEE